MMKASQSSIGYSDFSLASYMVDKGPFLMVELIGKVDCNRPRLLLLL